MNLALKYRPRQFDEVVGQKAVSVILQAMINKNTLSQVLLFTGPSGVGKTSMARIIAAQLNSEGATEVHQNTHPAVVEIDAASHGSVNDIRRLKTTVSYAIAGHRVTIIDEIHAISDEAFTALLNILESPPENNTFILITTELNRVPITIRHRSEHYPFKKASVDDLAARIWWVVAQENFSIDNQLVDLIAQRSEGSFRESMMLLKQVMVADISTVEQYNELLGEVDYGPTLIQGALGGASMAVSELENTFNRSSPEEIMERTLETLRDIMILHSGNTLNYSGKALDSRIELKSKLNPGQILKAMRIMWDLQTKLKNGNLNLGLVMAFTLIGDIFNPTEIAKPAIQKPQAAKPMSFAQMQNR